MRIDLNGEQARAIVQNHLVGIEEEIISLSIEREEGDEEFVILTVDAESFYARDYINSLGMTTGIEWFEKDRLTGNRLPVN